MAAMGPVLGLALILAAYIKPTVGIWRGIERHVADPLYMPLIPKDVNGHYAVANGQNSSMGQTDVNPHEDVTDVTRKMKENTKRDAKRAGSMNVYEMLSADAHLFLDNMMPGRQPHMEYAFGASGLTAFVSLVWLSIYLHKIYQNDRGSQDGPLDHWKHRARTPRQEDPRMANVKPDIVLVFHHPSFPYADKDNEIDASSVEACLIEDRKKGHFNRMEKCLESAAQTSSIMGKAQSMYSSLTRGNTPEVKTPEASPRTDSDVETGKKDSTLTLGMVREALLQDVYSAMPKSGFEVLSFSSIDDDEIFVGVSLENPDVVKEHLVKERIRLQLRHEVVKFLDIGQDPKQQESSPPFIQYDVRLAGNVLGNGRHDREFYNTFHGKHEQGSIISGTQRIRMINGHFAKCVNLDVAKKQGILKDWYPVHSVHWLADLNACWASIDLLKDLTFLQPMTLIHEYFGSRIGFTFAWNGLYCKMLLALLPVAVGCELLALMTPARGLTMCFSLVLMIWATIASNLWKREQQYFTVLWDLNTAIPEYSIRPDFFGTMQSMPEDHNKLSLQYPQHKYVLRQTFAWVVTILFCALDLACIYIWITLFEGKLDIVASACLAVLMMVFGFIFKTVVAVLIKFENHKFQADYYSSYLTKLFIFQFVNSFFAFFFIAIKQEHTASGCPNDDCIGLLRSQLQMTIGMIVVMNIFTVVFSSVKVHVMMWLEDRNLKKELDEAAAEASRSQTTVEVPVRGYVEEQSKYQEYRVREQIEGMMQLIIALGYVLIFGCVAPAIIFLCFIVFAVQLRALAFMTTRSSRRPLPRRSLGLGAWEGIVHFLTSFGVLFSGYLLVAFGETFKGTFLITKISGLVVWTAFLLSVLQLVQAYTRHSIGGSGSKLLLSRRQYVQERVRQENDRANIAYLEDELSTKLRGMAQYEEEILSADWDKIPHLVDAKQVVSPHFASTPAPARSPRGPR